MLVQHRPDEAAAMDPTKDAEEPETAGVKAVEAQPVTPERARARAYLDLWERHVAHTALHGATQARRPPE